MAFAIVHPPPSWAPWAPAAAESWRAWAKGARNTARDKRPREAIFNVWKVGKYTEVMQRLFWSFFLSEHLWLIE